MLKTLKLPSAEEFEASLDEAQKWAKSVGYNENDTNDIVKSVRKKKRVWGLFLLMIQSSLPILIINCFLIPFAHKLSAGSPILSFRIPQSNHGL